MLLQRVVTMNVTKNETSNYYIYTYYVSYTVDQYANN